MPKWYPSSGSRKHQRSFFQNHDCQFCRWIKGVCDDAELRKHERSSSLFSFLLSFPSLSPLSLATDNVEDEMIMMESYSEKPMGQHEQMCQKRSCWGPSGQWSSSSQWMTINPTQGALAMQLPMVSRLHWDIKVIIT